MCGCTSNLKAGEQVQRPTDLNKNVGLSGRNGKSGLTNSQIEQDCWDKLYAGKLGQGDPTELLEKCIKDAKAENRSNWVQAGLTFLNNLFGGGDSQPPPPSDQPPPPETKKEFPWGLAIAGGVLVVGTAAFLLLRKSNKAPGASAPSAGGK